ncbi:hypothetical protein TSTA_097000 [Talaromyces stipitatus ATCC 10500]|uniref:Uncharacterized protein n=1 Tax=Talaromyces stipitatus (strain ATCC 10500 / CBS 375.48 / QM 6759 / NRRL 1006) TaxID=441959 RepID=B8LZM8_TALSN|nr:uncharacterized protein TSTA_097000 [Talaromyces stipitatus ATCC 10500]EED22451.1 hypothetical protein TSTA_097000 [Talaromyces stipitatus ATCC 10500]
MAQVEESVLQAGNAAPGSDEIPTYILKVAWPLIKDKQRTEALGGTEYGMDLYTLQSISKATVWGSPTKIYK